MLLFILRDIISWKKRFIGYLPNNSLCAGANGFEILVAFENGETSVADLDGVEVRVARRVSGRHGASGRRVGHGPPRLKESEAEDKFTCFDWQCKLKEQ